MMDHGPVTAQLALVNRWVRAPDRTAIPECALGEVLRAHHLSVLDQKTKHVRVVIIPIAWCVSHRGPALPFREAWREARAKVLLISRCLGEWVQACAVGVDPGEVGGSVLTLR